MSRKAKNIIAIIAVVLLCGSIGYTGYLSTKTTNNLPAMEQAGGQPPEMPDGQAEPPEKPDGEMGGDNGSETTEPPEQPNEETNGDSGGSGMTEPPEKPDGESDMGTPPEMPGGEASPMGEQPEGSTSNNHLYPILFGVESLALSLVVLYLIMSRFNKKSWRETFANADKIIIFVLGTIVLTGGLTLTENLVANAIKNNAGTGGNPSQGAPMGQNASVSYAAVKEITESTAESGGNYESTTGDENVILASGDIDVALSDLTIAKSGDSDGGDSTSFCGNNSGILAKAGANLTLKNLTISTNATGANGVFSYGGSATTNNTASDGTQITISDSKITTTKDNSGGIMTTGGGIMNAKNLTVKTAGVSSAAIRSDRGGGTVTVDGGTYATSGAGSPAIYSTADITVKNASLVATASEGAVIEGKNKISLENVTLIDTNNKLNGQSTTYKNIFLYQSMSGDASTGVSEFSATDSTIITNKGDIFYITNTSSKITLSSNEFINNDSTGNFLRAQKDSWGNSGSNGGEVELLMTNQSAKGNIVIDAISTLDMTMAENSSYEGTINGENSAKELKVTLDQTAKIKLTGDSYLTALDNADSDNSNIDFNGYTLYVDGKAIN